MKLLRRDEVLLIVPFSRATLYAEIKGGRFPAPIKISRKAVAWHEDEILDYLKSRPRANAGNGQA